MKKHRDLLAVLRSNKMRITPARRLLLQYILDSKSRHLSLKGIHDFMEKEMPGVDRSSIYRNLVTFKRLDIIQELNLPSVGKRFQFVFDQKLHHYYICKVCGKLNRRKDELFKQIETALDQVPGFAKADLSAVFYGYCDKCKKKGQYDVRSHLPEMQS